MMISEIRLEDRRALISSASEEVEEEDRYSMPVVIYRQMPKKVVFRMFRDLRQA